MVLITDISCLYFLIVRAGERLQKVFEKLCIERKMKVSSKRSAENDYGDRNNDDNEEDVIQPPNCKKPRTVL